MPKSGRDRLTLALPADVSSLAYGDLTERLAGERGPAFQEVTDAPALVARTIYRDRGTGRFAKAGSWERSRARLAGTGRAGRFVRERVEVPTTGERLGERKAGRSLAGDLKALGVGPLRVRIEGQYAKEEGGPLHRWESTGHTAAGLGPRELASLLNAVTRTWQKGVKSPPVILVNRVEVERQDAAPRKRAPAKAGTRRKGKRRR